MDKINLAQDNVLELITNFPIEPMFNKVCITLNNLEEDGNLVLSENILSDVQFIVAVGKSTSDTLKPGQKVLIDIEKLMIPVRSEKTDAYETTMRVKIDPIEIDGVIYALVDDRIIKAKDNR